MKYIGILLGSICSFFIILGSLYYNCITIDMNNIENYIIESNRVYQDLTEEQNINRSEKNQYIKRLTKIKKGLENSKTTPYMNKYKSLKIKQLSEIIDNIKNKDSEQLCQNIVNYYNEKGCKEITNLIDKSFIEVTYLSIKSYIKI